ncbi:MAG: polysaccharide deacetylase family protein [Clostridia bacterium]|nr:polysaccharide deacetylase family protein [Clostridia bacterium]
MQRILSLAVCLSLLLFAFPALGDTAISVQVITAAPSDLPEAEETPLPLSTFTPEPSPVPTPEVTPESSVGATVVSAVTPDPYMFIIRYADRESNKIAITMDDCYEIDKVREALEICKQYDVHMTFYPIGKMLHEEDRDLWEEIIEQGSEIGTHSMWHNQLGNIQGNRDLIYALLQPQVVLDNILGYHYPIRTIRPPYGKIQDANGNISRVYNACRAVGFDHVVNWDVSQTTPELCVPRVQNGSILLFHARYQDVYCIRTIVPQLLEKGFELVTVTDLLGMGSVATSSDLFVLDYSKYLK